MEEEQGTTTHLDKYDGGVGHLDEGQEVGGEESDQGERSIEGNAGEEHEVEGRQQWDGAFLGHGCFEMVVLHQEAAAGGWCLPPPTAASFGARPACCPLAAATWCDRNKRR